MFLTKGIQLNDNSEVNVNSLEHNLSVRHYNCIKSEDTLAVSLSLIKKTLKSYGILYLEGHSCLHLDCPICISVKDKSSFQGKVFINKITGNIKEEI